MSALAQFSQPDAVLAVDVLDHLDVQLASARRLLQVVLEQSQAIRDRDVQAVVTLTGLLQAELQRRVLIETERARLLERAGLRLGIDAGSVTIELLMEIMDPVSAAEAGSRSAELRGMLDEIQREHHVNRVLMNQELAFLDHLMRLADEDNKLGYGAGGEASRLQSPRLSSRHRVLDMEV
jgi:flagellar biosynthesis/type III secretory pathway chaperone